MADNVSIYSATCQGSHRPPHHILSGHSSTLPSTYETLPHQSSASTHALPPSIAFFVHPTACTDNGYIYPHLHVLLSSLTSPRASRSIHTFTLQ